MQFADYNAFRVAFQHMLENDDTTSNTFSTATMDTIIGLGEGRVFNGDPQTDGLRASTMLATLSASVTSNAAALPADLLQLHELYFSGKRPIEIVPLDRLRRMESDDSGGGADTIFAAQAGDSMRFWPTASGTVLGTYYARPDDLMTGTWGDLDTFHRYPELFLYAALFEGAIFLGMTDKMGMWEARYRQLADGANLAEARRVYSGSPLRMRVR